MHLIINLFFDDFMRASGKLCSLCHSCELFLHQINKLHLVNSINSCRFLYFIDSRAQTEMSRGSARPQ